MSRKVLRFKYPRMKRTRHRKHYKDRNRHHNIARSKGGPTEDYNLILLKIETHNLIHRVFGNRTLKEIIAILERLDRMKERQRAA